VGNISINFGTNLLKLGHNQVALTNSTIIVDSFCLGLCQLIVFHDKSFTSK
jgi:hypothetical protein